MPQSACSLFKNSLEYRPAADHTSLPSGIRGIYVLFREGKSRPSKKDKYLDVVYIGMAGVGKHAGIAGRLKTHFDRKKGEWTHFSMFEVWDNITKDQISELEGLFRHIFDRDMSANRLAKQRSHKPLKAIRRTSANSPQWVK